MSLLNNRVQLFGVYYSTHLLTEVTVPQTVDFNFGRLL